VTKEQLNDIRKRDREKPPIEPHYRRQAFFDEAVLDRRRLLMALDDAKQGERRAHRKASRLSKKIENLHTFIRGGQGRPRKKPKPLGDVA